MKKYNKFFRILVCAILTLSVIFVFVSCTEDKPEPTDPVITDGDNQGEQGENGGNQGETGEQGGSQGEQGGEQGGEEVDEKTQAKNNLIEALGKNYDNITISFYAEEDYEGELVSYTDVYKNDGDLSYYNKDGGYSEYTYLFGSDGMLQVTYFYDKKAGKWVKSSIQDSYSVKIIDLKNITADDFSYFEGEYTVKADKMEFALDGLFNISYVEFKPTEIVLTLDENNFIKKAEAKTDDGISQIKFVVTLSDIGTTSVVKPELGVEITAQNKTITAGTKLVLPHLFTITEGNKRVLADEKFIDAGNYDCNKAGTYDIKLNYVSSDGEEYTETAVVTVEEAAEQLSFAEIYAAAQNSESVTLSLKDERILQIGNVIYDDKFSTDGNEYGFYTDRGNIYVYSDRVGTNGRENRTQIDFRILVSLSADKFVNVGNNTYEATDAEVKDVLDIYAPNMKFKSEYKITVTVNDTAITSIKIDFKYKLKETASTSFSSSKEYFVTDINATDFTVPEEKRAEFQAAYDELPPKTE